MPNTKDWAAWVCSISDLGQEVCTRRREVGTAVAFDIDGGGILVRFPHQAVARWMPTSDVQLVPQTADFDALAIAVRSTPFAIERFAQRFRPPGVPYQKVVAALTRLHDDALQVQGLRAEVTIADAAMSAVLQSGWRSATSSSS